MKENDDLFTFNNPNNQAHIYKSQKVFRMKTSAYRNGTLKNQPNKMETIPQHIHTILPTMLCVCYLVVCIGGLWKAVGRVSDGCVVHVDVHAHIYTEEGHILARHHYEQ